MSGFKAREAVLIAAEPRARLLDNPARYANKITF
jgi:hypothetical protein